ncbi:CoA transferase [Tepidiforma flava]|uniref:CoA transferase n=1 Tax=Tepidiforma flava TaxID=3004094 RepID=A0ABY7M9G0_9CHLR|nr:CoA transferase [Tepidiforma flava]WBL36694.1 CoA transferase [Tepidiforma flava]
MPPALPALAGIRVISAGQILAAPFCATLFAEFGAEVIKIEPPGTGEANRGNLSFEQDNRGQKSVTLDLGQPEGRALFRRLAATADLLVENFRPGTLEAWGLAPDALREENPGLVVVRISGYGQDGPYRDRAGFDRVALAFSGITAVTGYPDRPPVRPGYFIGDYGAGIFAAFGALAALRARDLTGRGQDVDVALYEAVWRMSGTHAANYGLTGRDRPRSGNYYPGVVPAEQFETADGHDLVINATTQRSFERLCAAMGQPELAADPRFTPRQNLLANHEAIHAIIRRWVAGLTLAEAQAALDRHGVPASKVYQVSDIVADDHYAAREQVVTVDSPVFGPVLQPGVVPRLTATPGTVPGRAPLLGEHNREVYQGLLGLADAELDDLAARGII